MKIINHTPSRFSFIANILLVATLHANTNEVIGKVVGVHDGDTLTVLTPTKVQVKVRLDGIDAPEMRQAFGEKSKQALSAMVFGKVVRVVVTHTDRYGRSVGDVYVDDEWVNPKMVADGFAWHYTQFSKSKELAKAEANARQQRVGLWRDKEQVPPWEFRKAERTK